MVYKPTRGRCQSRSWLDVDTISLQGDVADMHSAILLHFSLSLAHEIQS